MRWETQSVEKINQIRVVRCVCYSFSRGKETTNNTRLALIGLCCEDAMETILALSSSLPNEQCDAISYLSPELLVHNYMHVYGFFSRGRPSHLCDSGLNPCFDLFMFIKGWFSCLYVC